MEIFAVLFIILLLVAMAATGVEVYRDGYGHTPIVRSHCDWTAMNLPSRSYTSLREL
jgi:hypothetical protein